MSALSTFSARSLQIQRKLRKEGGTIDPNSEIRGALLSLLSTQDGGKKAVVREDWTENREETLSKAAYS